MGLGVVLPVSYQLDKQVTPPNTDNHRGLTLDR